MMDGDERSEGPERVGSSDLRIESVPGGVPSTPLEAARMCLESIQDGSGYPWRPLTFPAPTGPPEGTKAYGELQHKIACIRQKNIGRLQCLLLSAWTLLVEQDPGADVIWQWLHDHWAMPHGTPMPGDRIECMRLANQLVRYPWQKKS